MTYWCFINKRKPGLQVEVAERAAARAADEQSRQMEQAMAHEQAMAEARESQQQALQRAEAQVQPYEASQYHEKTSKLHSHLPDNLMLYRSKTQGRWCCPVQPIFKLHSGAVARSAANKHNVAIAHVEHMCALASWIIVSGNE